MENCPFLVRHFNKFLLMWGLLSACGVLSTLYKHALTTLNSQRIAVQFAKEFFWALINLFLDNNPFNKSLWTAFVGNQCCTEFNIADGLESRA